jgi:hypothetical protein
MCRRSIGGCRTVYKLKIGVELLLPRLCRLVLCPNMVETVVILAICYYVFSYVVGSDDLYICCAWELNCGCHGCAD